ncbi:hypothetical protein E2C05_30150, partial [Paracraurococcus ruber]|uniref:hypothetical protein n=1 Tax=Paracraurococcus ruber TaxID=77675 RepID=UPI001962177D
MSGTQDGPGPQAPADAGGTEGDAAMPGTAGGDHRRDGDAGAVAEAAAGTGAAGDAGTPDEGDG